MPQFQNLRKHRDNHSNGRRKRRTRARRQEQMLVLQSNLERNGDLRNRQVVRGYHEFHEYHEISRDRNVVPRVQNTNRRYEWNDNGGQRQGHGRRHGPSLWGFIFRTHLIWIMSVLLMLDAVEIVELSDVGKMLAIFFSLMALAYSL